MHGFLLATEPLGFLGVLIFMIIALLFFGVFIAVTFGPIALVIAAIVRSFRNMAAANWSGTNSTGISFTTSSSEATMSSSEVVVTQEFGGSFGQALGTGLQQALGQQLGQRMGELMSMAAAQHPLELQLAPMVMAIEAARRPGDVASVRPFLTDRLAARFPSLSGGRQGGGLAAISHVAVLNDAAMTGNHVVVRIDWGTAGSAHGEYWTFQKVAPVALDGTPVVCPRCGAPTAGDSAGTCRFCGATLSTALPTLPPPTRWLLDDISATPPPLAA